MSFKEKVYQQYLQLVNDKIVSLQKILNELSDSAKNETKSTAGDKHETALAMLQQEQQNISIKLSEALEQQKQLKIININFQSDKITRGSLIKTDKGYLFLSIALGKITVDHQQIIALSPQSPLGAKLLGLQVNDYAEINNIKYLILKIH